MTYSFKISIWLGFMVVMLFLTCMPEVAHAQQQGGQGAGSADICTSFKDGITKMKQHNLPAEGAILSDIYRFIKQTVGQATQTLFSAFTSSFSYQYAFRAAITLMIIFYGVAFTIGIVQPSFQQALIRLIKLGVVSSVVSPWGWTFFSNHVVRFFQDGTDDLIIGMQSIAIGGIPLPAGATPFWALDNIADFVIQPDTIIAVLGSIGAGGPYGLLMGGLMGIALGGFIKMLLNVLKTYAISYVARAMLLGVAPIFFIFLLFDKTKQMFISWLNALVNLSLQPLLLFTFLSFFLVMVESAIGNTLDSELCWTDFRNVEGSTNKIAFWRFVDPTTKEAVTGDYTYEGALECLINNDKTKCKEFPVDAIDLLSFLILVYIMLRFAEVVKGIASELSNAFVNLDSASKFEQFMQDQKKSGGGSGLNIPAAGQTKPK